MKRFEESSLQSIQRNAVTKASARYLFSMLQL